MALSPTIIGHPQFDIIKSGIMNGWSLGKIRKTIDPPIPGVGTLSRFRTALLEPSLRKLQYRSNIAGKPLDRAVERSVQSLQLSEGDAIRQGMYDELKSKRTRRNRWIKRAESDDKLALAGSLDDGDTRILELEAKMRGLLKEGSDVTVQIAVVTTGGELPAGLESCLGVSTQR
jgi:hypothetical protein